MSIKFQCRECGSECVRHGKVKNKQRWKCTSCGTTQFRIYQNNRRKKEGTDIETLLRDYVFAKVEARIIEVDFTGYIVDIKLPVGKDVALYLVEENKVKRYLAKFNPTWMMSIPLEFISDLELIGFDEISEQLADRRMNMYS